MKNITLADDYLQRAGHRLAAVAVLMERKSYADVVRESQEIVELCLKALLQHSGVENPRLHDVSDILKQQKSRLPKKIHPHVVRMCAISKDLRRDRELAFYGTEDLTPSEFYEEKDAGEALQGAQWIYSVCGEVM